MKAGNLNDRVTHDDRWSLAEQSRTDYGAQPTETETLWFSFSQAYRWVIRNEGAAVQALSIVNAQGFILWFTDVTNAPPVHLLTQPAWEFAQTISVAIEAAQDLAAFLLFVPVLLEQWAHQMSVPVTTLSSTATAAPSTSA